MKEIILTDQETRQVDTFLEFTSSRITEELKLWESLKVYTENAEKNVELWKSTAQAVNKLRVQLPKKWGIIILLSVIYSTKIKLIIANKNCMLECGDTIVESAYKD